MAGNLIELSPNRATGSSWLSEVNAAASVNCRKKPETEFPAVESGPTLATYTAAVVGGDCQGISEMESVEIRSNRLPQPEKPETETSDGDQNLKVRRRHRRKRKYGRLKRIRVEGLALPLDGLALPMTDTATESESEKRFIAVDGPQVGIFRSPTASSTGADGSGRSWLGRKFQNRNRKSAATGNSKRLTSERTTTTTTTVNRERRCERYLKQFVAALFSTVGLLCLMVGYTVLGGYVFRQLESSNEVTVKADMRQVTALSFTHHRRIYIVAIVLTTSRPLPPSYMRPN